MIHYMLTTRVSAVCTDQSVGSLRALGSVGVNELYMPVPTDSERPVSPCGPCAAHAMQMAISHMFPADCAAIYVRFRASSVDLYTQLLH